MFVVHVTQSPADLLVSIEAHVALKTSLVSGKTECYHLENVNINTEFTVNLSFGLCRIPLLIPLHPPLSQFLSRVSRWQRI